ncbi:T9SS type B sorting domain-containing protein [Subsaxibacter sp. CAU 1640]|uniref:T9SS type B sorting domain-containing protein n=1 Tax=Subsaxibacter sp. CAU 1640 TaxID=2933271 RepID=UPI002006CBD7|nr:T9SS type B sorting domain-containing protein [Subsaxibacter sp. CAU 1640]MCK7590630.1 T9SS type B sorting domain-containing protein [Subsaxibacter sp. CAU 1640]
MKKKLLTFGMMCWLCLVCQYTYAQLGDFNFSVTTTDETCAGNGSISMTVSGTTPNATIVYLLYRYPDTGTPIAQTSANSFNNLSSGNYLVVARQTLGNEQNTQNADATINDLTTTLNFEIAQAFAGNCDAADLVVNVLNGNAASYEILSGPVTAPEQPSNVFEDMPPGTYVVRVYDDCNNALTKTYTILLENFEFNLGMVTLPSVYDNCTEATISNTLIPEEEEGVLAYPISVEYIITPPDGSPVINLSHTYNSGPESELVVSELIQLYGNQEFYVQVIAQDVCGNIESVVNEVDPNPNINAYTSPGECGVDLNVQITHFLPPLTFQFTQSPSGFDPEAYNGNHPGPFPGPVVVFHNDTMGVPYGEYTLVVTDACGRTRTHSFELEEEPIEPEVSATNGGCDPEFGTLTASIPDRDIMMATFTSVPSDYPGTAPVDISEHIDNGTLIVQNLPQGSYELELIDNCGNTYIEQFTIPAFSEQPLSVTTTPNCTTETGTLRIGSPYGKLVSVMIITAPAAFAQSLPYDYSANILPIGVFYAGEMPEGTYTIELIDNCGNEFEMTTTVSSYQSNPTIYDLQRNCGSFNIGIDDPDESVWDQTYWFQRFFPDTNTWGHPYTGAGYTEGTMPNSTNAIQIQDEETIFNIFLTGQFRLIKAFQPFNNPTPNQRCYDVFAEFEVSSELVINDVYNLNCEGATGPSDILVDVTGVEPYSFSIVSPITIDNGNNNIFTNLSPGTYEIRVEDVCGSIATTIVNLEDLLPVVNIFTPSDMVMCSEEGNTQATFDLSEQNEDILNGQNPNNYTVTYHLNQQDADTGNNPQPEIFGNSVSPQTIYARVIHNTLNVCYATTSFQLIVGDYPLLGPDETTSVCDGTIVTLSTTAGYDSYVWSTGATTPSINVDTAGNYTVTVSNNYSDFSCEATQTFTVLMSGIATIDNVIVEDFLPYGNALTVQASGPGDYEYSIDGINYQPENFFTNLSVGEYTVYVRDRNECGVVTETVYVMDYMKFFTPNGDTFNEHWQVLGSEYEPNMEIIIFDRYGKLLTAFKGEDIGWDGTYNGHNMPTNDYWFVITRTDGRTYTGHFTLKR